MQGSVNDTSAETVLSYLLLDSSSFHFKDQISLHIYLARVGKGWVTSHHHIFIIISLYVSVPVCWVMSFPCDSSGKEPTCSAGDEETRGKTPWRRHGNPLQYSCLENPMDRGAWWATVQRLTKSWTRLKWLSTHFMHMLSEKAAFCYKNEFSSFTAL